MQEAIDRIINYLKLYYVGNEVYVYVALLCASFLLLFDKEIRKKYIIPLLLIVFIVLNPLLYEKIFSRSYMYWRFFWIFSLHLIIGSAFLSLIDKLKLDSLAIVLFVGICFLIISNGENVFETSAFQETVSLEKLPEGVVEVAEVMLNLEEEPKCINDTFICDHIREYSGKIKQAYGRNYAGLISNMPEDVAELFYSSYKLGDFYEILEYAYNNGYNFIVTEKNRELPIKYCIDFGFEKIYDYKDLFHVYHYVGIGNVSIPEDYELTED